jgi:hypothetical protein
MPNPVKMDSSKPSFAGFLKASGLPPLGGKKGDGGVVVNLYNQGSAATVEKAGVSGGQDSATSGAGLDGALEQKIVNVHLKDASNNGPIWQMLSAAFGSGV